MGSAPVPAFARLLTRQRLLVAGGLLAVIAVSWSYLLWMAHDMTSWAMPDGMMEQPGVAWTLVMWVVMMAAMMFPTAAPMIVMHARFQRGRDPARSPALRTLLFGLGYGIAWTGFAALATAVQVGLEGTRAMHPMAMALTSAPAAGAVLIAAGGFQLTSLKNACLTQCRSPLGFFMTSWREGPGGALRMGLRHGASCVGCCWALMAIMFVVGTMNMFWVAALTGFVLLEKLGPRPRLVSRGSAVLLVTAGIWVAAAA